MFSLSPIRQFKVPIDAGCISPNIFSGKSNSEIAALQAWDGNKKVKLSDLFKISHENEKSEEECVIKISGDLKKVRRIGAAMSTGKILIEGDVGNHLGEEMTGGTIIVNGNAGLWAGSMMKNGIIEIKGNAGDNLGVPYRGSVNGMNGGKIIVYGNAGNEIGGFMRGGLIKIYGNVGQFAGIHMRKGTIFIQGNSEGRLGAQMIKGKIVLSGYTPSILPTFNIDNLVKKTKIDGEEVLGPFYTFIGDISENGDGRLFISQTANEQLKNYEKFLG